MLLYVWPHVIGPFSTTLVPLSSSSSVDRQVLINVEASAISPDERTFGFIFTKIPVQRRSDEEKKIIKELGPDCPYFQFVCAPPIIFLAPAATATQIEQTSPNASCWEETPDNISVVLSWENHPSNLRFHPSTVSQTAQICQRL